MSTTGPAATTSASSTTSSSISPSNSISLIKLDELSSFGATKRARLPALIKLNNNPLSDLNSRESTSQQQQQQQPSQPQTANSMPDFSESQVDKMAVQQQQQQQSLPANVPLAGAEKEVTTTDKENRNQDISVDGFQVVDMDDQQEQPQSELIGPSLPQPSTSSAQTTVVNAGNAEAGANAAAAAATIDAQLNSTSLNNDPATSADYASHLGDSLIEMIINLRNENQNLVRALETNNDYVKERLSEFKRCQEESKKREQQYAMEKAEHEHQIRKLQRQNSVMSDRLKSMEAKLKDMKLEVSESLTAAHSSKASSIRGGEEILYPELRAGDDADESFSNPALDPAASACATMQVDATDGELYNEGDGHRSSSASARPMELDGVAPAAAATTTTTTTSAEAVRVGQMTREQLSKRFDASKADFLALDDPMKQCDQLEQQLNAMGKRDYEICLMQQQLNIYRQDFRLERMAKLEAKIQIEKLKCEIDRLCLERAQTSDESAAEETTAAAAESSGGARRGAHFGPTPATAAADGLIGKLGHHLGRKAIKSAAKAAKYAAKQAHLEEKTAAALARAAAAKAAAVGHMQGAPTYHHQTSPKAGPETTDPTGGSSSSEQSQHPPPPHHLHGSHHHRRGHHHRHHHHERPHHHEGGPAAPLPPGQRARTERTRGVGSEIVSDLINLGNKTMLTGYKMASTHVNLALDKLNQYEQQQAAQLAAEQNRQANSRGASTAASAPPMEHPSMD